MIAEEPKSFI